MQDSAVELISAVDTATVIQQQQQQQQQLLSAVRQAGSVSIVSVRDADDRFMILMTDTQTPSLYPPSKFNGRLSHLCL